MKYTRYILNVLILFFAFYILFSLKNTIGVLLASALFALDFTLEDVIGNIIFKFKEYIKLSNLENKLAQKILEAYSRKDRSAKQLIKRYIIHLVINFAIWMCILEICLK